MQIISNNSTYLNNKRIYNEAIGDILPDTQLGVNMVRDGFILPKSDIYISKGGVVDNRRIFVQESAIDNTGSFIRIDGGYVFDEYTDEYYETPIIYLGYFFRHWGHFLMDCTTRMWILLEEAYKDYKVAFPNHPENILDGNYNRFLELLDVNEERIIPITKPSRFHTIIIPTEARLQPQNRHTNEWYSIFDMVSKGAVYDKSCIPSKVYFSRSKFGKPELGEKEIEENFRRNGYTIVYPEELTLDDQIGIFQYADEVVSSNSSICMNVVFARKGLKWTVINKYSAVHNNFSELRYEKNLDLTYVDAYSDKLNIYGNIIGSLPYLVSFNDNMVRLFEDNNLRYKRSECIYRFTNICNYLFKCLVCKPKNCCKAYLARLVRRMKVRAPWLYGMIKRVMQLFYCCIL